MSITKKVEAKMKSAIEHLEKELKNIRTGRANPAILDSIRVTVYGTEMGIKELGSITTPEPRMLQITLFDKNNANAVAKAIQTSNLGLTPHTDGQVIRINIPAMDQDQRKKMVKRSQELREHAKISIRNERAEGNKTARKDKSDGLIPEDVEKKIEKEIQELTDKFCKMADDITNHKEHEIMTI